jgi:hypothetical protein
MQNKIFIYAGALIIVMVTAIIFGCILVDNMIKAHERIRMAEIQTTKTPHEQLQKDAAFVISEIRHHDQKPPEKTLKFDQ